MNINLDNELFFNKKLPMLSGRQLGRDARAYFGIGKLEFTTEKHTISFPKELRIIHSSFFSGLLGQTILKLGHSDFRYFFQLDISNMGDNYGEDITDTFDDFIHHECMNPNMYKKQDWEKFSENY
jgi:hypothetical protein